LSRVCVDLEEAWFTPAACHRHPTAPSEAACARCGTFCCADCLDTVDRACCPPCANVGQEQQLRHEAVSIALKLAIGPAFVALASLWLLASQRSVPPIFAVWLVPMICAFALVRTERPGLAWLGALASIALLAWLAIGVTWAERYERLTDVVMLSIAPLVALPGCVRLSRAAERHSLTSASASSPKPSPLDV
jgi:hypothetical protein